MGNKIHFADGVVHATQLLDTLSCSSGKRYGVLHYCCREDAEKDLYIVAEKITCLTLIKLLEDQTEDLH